MSLRKCEMCESLKGYPVRAMGVGTYASDGTSYTFRDVRYLCWDCKTREELSKAEARAKRDAEEKRKLEEIGARFREAEKKKWGLPR